MSLICQNHQAIGNIYRQDNLSQPRSRPDKKSDEIFFLNKKKCSSIKLYSKPYTDFGHSKSYQEWARKVTIRNCIYVIDSNE